MESGGQVGWLDCCLTDIREGGTKNKKGDEDRCKLAVQKIQKEQGRAEQHCWSVPRVHKTTRLFFERTRWKMYEIWKQFNQIWLYLSSIQDILCVCLRRYFLYVIRSCSRQWLKSFLSFSNKEQLPQTSVSISTSVTFGGPPGRMCSRGWVERIDSESLLIKILRIESIRKFAQFYSWNLN